MPAPAKSNPLALAVEKTEPAPLRVAANTDAIVNRNLFDPERGAGATRQAEETSRASQRVRNMILLGTVIIGSNRTALLQDGTDPKRAPAAAAQPPQPIRLKLGDNIEGYRLAEIADKKVVFTKDATRIELVLDYFRKVEVPPPGTPTPPGRLITPGASAPGTRVVPNLPRRGRIPVPGNPNSDS